jgi:UPF0755 protein
VSLIRLAKFCFILLLCALAASYLVYRHALNEPVNLPDQGILLEISKGESLHAVLQRLNNLGVIPSVWPAKLYVKQRALFESADLANKIHTGEFRLTPPMTLPYLLRYLSANNQVSYSIQFIEGSRFKDALLVLENDPRLSKVLTGLSDPQIAQALDLPEGSSLEGQLYPDTYAFHKGDSDLDLLIRAHNKLKKVLEEEWQNRQSGLPLKTAYEALILASIIEKETGVPEERSEIAGVFTRRLQKKMRLQTDPTVIYGLGEAYAGNIKSRHLREATPYNTYRIAGLPPTPIALVGRAAIHAALHPKPGNSLYFVARGDGTHQFSATLEEHNKAVRQYQLKRREGYRSSVK